MSVDMKKVSPIVAMLGEDQEETDLLKESYAEADAYVRSFGWCRGVKEAWYGAGIGGVVAVFLFRIDPAPGADEWLWVVVGDLPSCYLVTDQAETPAAALEVYCDLMDGWIEAVRKGSGLDDVYPVAAPPTTGNADMLEKRVAFLRSKVIPTLA